MFNPIFKPIFGSAFSTWHVSFGTDSVPRILWLDANVWNDADTWEE